jgi:two-component system, OmpR family, sensor kinase
LGQLTDFNVSLARQASEPSAAAYDQATWLMGGTLAVSGMALLIVIAQVRRQISYPLLDLGRVMRRLAANDTDVEVGHTERHDEIGAMARAVVVFRGNAIQLMQAQRELARHTTTLEEKLAHEQSVAELQRNFVSMITHEFRTPLTRIDAQAQRLNNLKERVLPREISDRTGRIRSSVTGIVRLIDHLVDTTRLMDPDPDMFFHPEPMDLTDVLRDVCRIQREVDPGVRIIERLPAEPLSITGDAKLLSEAFNNLIANAVKYSPNHEKIVVRAERACGGIAVTVADQGIGIPAGDLGHVFTRYYRGSNVSSYVGTGIGLFLVATVIRLHAGHVGVESEEGNGTRVTVTLQPAENRLALPDRVDDRRRPTDPS